MLCPKLWLPFSKEISELLMPLKYTRNCKTGQRFCAVTLTDKLLFNHTAQKPGLVNESTFLCNNSPLSTKVRLCLMFIQKRMKSKLYCTRESKPIFTGKQIFLKTRSFNNSNFTIISEKIKQTNISHVFILLHRFTPYQIHTGSKFVQITHTYRH